MQEIAHHLGLSSDPEIAPLFFLLQILNILAKYGYAAAYNGLEGLHRLIEAFKHTYAVRMNLGDPDFVDVDSVVADMLDPNFAASLQSQIFDNTTFPTEYYGGRYKFGSQIHH